MRVLIISIYYKPEPVPKPHELAEGLAKRGHVVTVLTSFPNYPSGQLYSGYALRPWLTEMINGVRVVRLPLYPNHSGRPLLRLLHILTFSFSLLLLGPFLSGPAEIVYVWGNPPTSGLVGSIISCLRGARFVYGVHDLWPELVLESGMVGNSLIVRMIGGLERFVLNQAHLVLPISYGFKQKILQKGVSLERVHVIPHWADEKLYRPVPRNEFLAERLDLSNCFVVLYAGNIGRLQGLDKLIGAAYLLREEMTPLRVVIIGDGVERERLKMVVANHQIKNVIFIERQRPEEIVAYSALADVLYVGLVPSSLSSLSVPSKVPTYMACGRPILSSVAGETARLIERGGFGINCEADTPDGIAEGIRQIASLSEQERIRMGGRARQVFMCEFAMDRLLIQHEQLMKTLL